MILLKNKLPPSPRAKHARKPLFNKQAITTSSLDRIKNKDRSKYPNEDSTARSMKEKKHNFDNYEFRDKQNISDFNNKSIQTNVFTISRNVEKNVCKYHKTRKAANYSEGRTIQYLCFQCSLYEARRGTKLLPISPTATGQQKGDQRENELKNYFNKIKQMQEKIASCINKKVQQMQTLQIECNNCIQNQKQRFQQKMRKASEQYVMSLEVINSYKKQENKKIQYDMTIIQQKLKLIKSSKLDIQKNYSQCISRFNDAQFRVIMNKYWKYAEQNIQSLDTPQKHACYQNILNQKIKKIFQKRQDDGKDLKQFTFSKKNVNFNQSPQSNKQFEGIKIISSNYVNQNMSSESNCFYIKGAPLEL